WHIALHKTSVANATLISNLAPIFVTLFNWLLLDQRISKPFLLGLCITTLGTLSLVGGPSALDKGHIEGDGVALLAGLAYAGYILLVGWVRQSFSTNSVMIWSTGSAALFTLPVALMFEGSLFPLTMAGWLTVVGLAWVSHVGGQGCIAFALAALPTSFSSLTLLIQPVVAGILAWMFLGEALTAYQFVGGMMVLTGILIARKG
ncbi:MAG: DMT family transporter, partial [Parvibaculaceae bacterium]